MRHFFRHFFGELAGFFRAVFHFQHGHRGAQAQKAHAVTTLAHDFDALLFQRQAVDFDHVVEHAGEHAHDFFVFFPIERGFVGERVADEFGQIDRTQQAGTIRWQWLFATRVGGADVFAPPVVVHFVDAVDQNETRLGEVIGGRHDAVPQLLRADMAIDFAGDQTVFAGHVIVAMRPFAPDDFFLVFEIDFVLFFVC